MIKELHLHQIGPVPDLLAKFGSRLNLVTGDNGLGKTFLLDACWYTLTRTWADDRTHYQKIVVALSETIRLMAEIDQVIAKHGGWPLK